MGKQKMQPKQKYLLQINVRKNQIEKKNQDFNRLFTDVIIYM